MKKNIKKVVPSKKNIHTKTSPKKPVRKINYKRILIFILAVYIIISTIVFLINIKIKRIIVKGNDLITDQQVIEAANLEKYPSYFGTSKRSVSNKIKKAYYIKNLKVEKTNFQFIITVVEDYPVFYDSTSNLVFLSSGKKVSDKMIAPTLINYVPDVVAAKFLNEMKKVDPNIIKRISEIQYKPNEVDDSRFFLFMNDGNYVYLTISKFDLINDYDSIIENIIVKFGNQKGILNLDSGGYFDILN